MIGLSKVELELFSEFNPIRRGGSPFAQQGDRSNFIHQERRLPIYAKARALENIPVSMGWLYPFSVLGKLFILFLINALAPINCVLAEAVLDNNASSYTEVIDVGSVKATHSGEGAIGFLESYKRVLVGTVRKTADGKQDLIVNGSSVFNAYKIGSRSQSEAGRIALDAITDSRVPIDLADVESDILNGKLNASLSEIWILDTDKPPLKISPFGVDAVKPIISPDGNRVAFTGRKIDSRGFRTSSSLYVMDVNSRAFKIYTSETYREGFSIVAIEWLNNGKALRVITDFGETGGHIEIRTISF